MNRKNLEELIRESNKKAIAEALEEAAKPPQEPQRTRWQKIKTRLNAIRRLLFAPLCLILLQHPISRQPHQLEFPLLTDSQFGHQHLHQLERQLPLTNTFSQHPQAFFVHDSSFPLEPDASRQSARAPSRTS